MLIIIPLCLYRGQLQVLENFPALYDRERLVSLYPEAFCASLPSLPFHSSEPVTKIRQDLKQPKHNEPEHTNINVPKSVWKLMAERLPIGQSTKDRLQRRDLFRKMDNGNGCLSLAEIENGLLTCIGNGLMEIAAAKRVLKEAFCAVKGSAKRLNCNYADFRDFRKLLCLIRQYFEYYAMFQQTDIDNDRKISFSEFKSAIPLLKRWNLDVINPKEAFGHLDKNNSGMTFCCELLADIFFFVRIGDV